MTMPIRRAFRGRVILLASVAVALWLATPQAQAQEPTETPSAVAQYVEAVVTASEPSVPGTTKETSSSLSPTARRALKQTPPSTAAALERIATSSTYGAPQGLGQRGGEVGITPTSDSVGSALQATASATTSDPRLFGLLLVVITTTVGTIALAFRRLRLATPRPEETSRRK